VITDHSTPLTNTKEQQTKLRVQMTMKLLIASLLYSAVLGFAPVTTTTAFIGRAFQHSSSSSTSLDAYKKVFVAGGSRGVGRAVIDKLLAEGSEVVALLRSDESVAELSALEGVQAIKGDAFDYKSVENAMDGCDAAVTTLGGATGDNDKRVDYEGNSNVIEAAGILGVTRLILVTSIGCGTSKDAAPPAVFEVLKDVLAAKERAEKLLIKYYTNMNWTIIRPGGLKSERMTGKAILTADTKALGSIHREDVANLVVQALSSPKTERTVLSAD
jgi:nucleoside-diphosphate-sugar epimerase